MSQINKNLLKEYTEITFNKINVVIKFIDCNIYTYNTKLDPTEFTNNINVVDIINFLHHKSLLQDLEISGLKMDVTKNDIEFLKYKQSKIFK